MPEQLQGRDPAGNLYEVSADHSQARPVGADGWKPMAQIRFEVGPLTLVPETDGDDA